VSREDIKATALPALRHRLLTTFAARVEGVRADAILARLL
jgi:MoxR-like ATPase